MSRPSLPRKRRAAPAPESRLIVGVRAVEAMLQSAPERVIQVYYEAPLHQARARVVGLAQSLGLQTEAAQQLEQRLGLEGLRTQGIAALVHPAPLWPWAELIAQPQALIIAFDQVTDPRNLGAVLRSAEAFGATGALLTRDRCVHPNATVARTSAGASELVPIAIETNLARALGQARDAGFEVVSADLEGEAPEDFHWARPLVLVVGAEGRGLRQLTRAQCTRHLRIPMFGKTESLNVSVAASILLYEASKRAGAPS